MLCIIPLTAALLCCFNCQDSVPVSDSDIVQVVQAAARDGKLAWMLTEPQEVEDLLGPPPSQQSRDDGGMNVLLYEYPGVHLMFGKFRDKPTPHTLRRVISFSVKTNADGSQERSNPQVVDIGENRTLVLRNNDDLAKLDDFWGFAGVSLVNCDLRERAELLNTMPFDTRTAWPGKDRLPAGFDPQRLLEEGKNPGLGLRQLHAAGVDGRGVRIAVIDQPMTPDHREFKDRIERYEMIGVEGVPPQMHGPPIASIAVGRTCGVAPGARLSYFAVPMWKPDNAPYCEAIEKILDENEKLPLKERVRVVSISTGMFANHAGYDRWQQVRNRAAAAGLLVVTCDQFAFRYGTLTRKPTADADDPAAYASGPYGVAPEATLVPTGGRTTASHHGADVYTYWTAGGMSWAAPYIAGLAALAFQANAAATPEEILTQLRQTATKTEAGLVVNPKAFIEKIRRE